MTAFGYEDDAILIQRQTSIITWIGSILKAAASVMDNLSPALISRDLPSALSYEANQMESAGYQLEAVQVNRPLSGLKNRKEAIHKGAAAIIAWDKQLRQQNTPRSATVVRPAHTFIAR